MPTTYTSLLTQLRDRLDESTARAWEDDQLRRWLNEGARDIARRAEILLARDDVAATAGVQEYLLATNIVRVHRVEWRATGDDNVYPLQYRDFQNMDGVWWTGQVITENTPAYFTLWGYTPLLKMVVFPKPSEAGSFKVFSYKLPVEIALNGTEDGNSVDLPEGWSDLTLDYAEYRALRKDGNPTWQEAKGLYDENLGQLIDHSRRWTDQSGMIEGSDAPHVPGWLYGMEGWDW